MWVVVYNNCKVAERTRVSVFFDFHTQVVWFLSTPCAGACATTAALDALGQGFARFAPFVCQVVAVALERRRLVVLLAHLVGLGWLATVQGRDAIPMF